MRVRVFNKDTNNYFVSEVYAIINTGYYEKYLVLEETDNERYFRMFDFIDKSDKTILPVNINTISSNELPEPWIYKTEPDLKYFTDKLDFKDKYNSIYNFRGYAFIFEQKDLLIILFKGNKVSYEEIMGNKKQICTKLAGWNYVESEKDIQNLMKAFCGFHDSVLRTLSYISGHKKDENGFLILDNVRQISMVFDSQWSNSIEITFEAMLALNLRPAKDNYTSELFSATILLKDKTILFYDDHVTSEHKDYKGTWLNSLGMRWRFI